MRRIFADYPHNLWITLWTMLDSQPLTRMFVTFLPFRLKNDHICKCLIFGNLRGCGLDRGYQKRRFCYNTVCTVNKGSSKSG